nr:uncharacterized protein LOC128700771 isoform X2 [Cherax quadricarinatus]
MSMPRLKLRDPVDLLPIAPHSPQSITTATTTTTHFTPVMANAALAPENTTTDSRSTTRSTVTEPAATHPSSQPPCTQPITNHSKTIQSAVSHQTGNPHMTNQPQVSDNGRWVSEPIPKKKRLLEASASVEVREMIKTSNQKEDPEDILARVCSAVGIDSDLVENVVDEPPAGHHQSEVFSNTHGVPANIQYLRGVRPPPINIPLGNRLRHPEVRFHHGMHPKYRPTAEGSYTVAEVRHHYHQYQPHPPDPTYTVQHRIPMHPGEPHPYRHFPQYSGRYQLIGSVGPVSPPINRPPMMRARAPSEPGNHRLSLPHGSPAVLHSTDLRPYPSPALHHSPPGAPTFHHDTRFASPDMHHAHPRHKEVPYGIPPRTLHNTPGAPPQSPEQSSVTVASRPSPQQVSDRPNLQSHIEHQKHGTIREMYIPANSVNIHHSQGALYSVNAHPSPGQYRPMHPQLPEGYPKHPFETCPEAVRDVAWHGQTSQAPIMSTHASPERFRATVPIRPLYTPEQLKSCDPSWGVKRPSDSLDKPPERIQGRRLMEPPKPCVELIPIGPPLDAKETKSRDSPINISQRQADVIDLRRQSLEANISQHIRPLKSSHSGQERTAQWQNHVAQAPQATSLQDSHHHNPSTENPEVSSRNNHPFFRRCLSLEPPLNYQLPRVPSRKDELVTGTLRGQGHSRSKSDTAVLHDKTYNNNNYEASKKSNDCKYDTCKPMATLDNGDKQTALPANEQQVTQNKPNVSEEKTNQNTKHNSQLEGSSESHHSAESKKTEVKICHVGPGQLHRLHSSRYVNLQRPASEPPLRPQSMTNNTVSNKRPASVPGAGQLHYESTTTRCQNSLPHHTISQDKSLTQTPNDTFKDEAFMGRLKLVLNDLLSVPEALKLQQASCSPEQQLASVIRRGGAQPSQDPNPHQRLREDFLTVVKLCLPSALLQDWGWESCTPDQILNQLIKVAHNGEEGTNGGERSTSDSPLHHDEVLEDEVFSPAVCDKTLPPILPPQDFVSHGLNTSITPPTACTTATPSNASVTHPAPAHTIPAPTRRAISPRCTDSDSNVATKHTDSRENLQKQSSPSPEESLPSPHIAAKRPG